MSNSFPFVSVVIPCRDEEKFIEAVIKNLLDQDYPQSKTEIIFVDGQSKDQTIAIIQKYGQQYSFIKLLYNERKIVPVALNLAIKESHGDIIVRMDAHSIYPTNYISELVKQLIGLKADNVGGVWETLAGDDTLMAKSIALAVSSPFGIGNASYRLSGQQIKQTDTVPFGCYRRDVFEKIGLFDEDLVRNQDDEFNARLVKSGGKIFLIPSVVIKYFARPTISKISKMFYQYGLFKPWVNKKLSSAATIRQFFPPGLILFNLFFIFLCILYKSVWMFLGIFWGIYFITGFLFAIRIASVKKQILLSPIIPFIFSVIHFSYGWGYLKGIIYLLIYGRIPAGNITINR